MEGLVPKSIGGEVILWPVFHYTGGFILETVFVFHYTGGSIRESVFVVVTRGSGASYLSLGLLFLPEVRGCIYLSS